ncbi:MAG: hypothetical protein MAG795_00235 [Candidatus Woesearchaeota archaeon]|nr:hypothetical protein [Candidatus Woesearchaeota archaeon]
MKTLLLDMDKVLAPATAQPGSRKVKEILTKKYGNIGLKIGNEFIQIFNDFDDYYHDIPNKNAPAIIKELNKFDIEVPENFKGKNFMWSRGLRLKYLFNKYSIKSEGKEIKNIVDEYWKATGVEFQVYEDSKKFLRNSKNPRFIITSSDGILNFKGQRIIYNPEYAIKKKIQRLKLQGICKFIPPERIFVGDPIDKPKKGFWEKVLKAANTQPKNCIVVDDSIKVIRSAIKLGMKGILLDRYNYYKDMQDRPGVYAVDMKGFNSVIDQL